MLCSCAPGALGCAVLFLVACARPLPSVAEGRSLYLANGCVSCHGLFGRGDGPMAAKLSYQPIDLRNASLFRRGYGEAEIAKTLAEGVLSTEASVPQLHHTHHELAMPKFDHLTDIERRSIAQYVISLRTGSVSHDAK